MRSSEKQNSQSGARLDQSLVHHRVRDLEETRNVRSIHVIAGRAVLLGGAIADFVDSLHDVIEPVIHLFARPRDAHTVLRHLQAGRSDTACVRGFAGTEKNPRLEKLMDAVDSSRHVRALADNIDAVLQQIGRVFGVDLVLRRTRERALRLVVPEWIVIQSGIESCKCRAFELLSVFGNTAAADILEVHHKRKLFASDSLCVVNITARV